LHFIETKDESISSERNSRVNYIGLTVTIAAEHALYKNDGWTCTNPVPIVLKDPSLPAKLYTMSMVLN
jgi:hypothetical protein